jgi:hypothetical protein
MSNTTISLPNRVLKLKDAFQKIGEDTWNTWDRGNRAGFILGTIDTESIRYDDSFTYDIFYKAYHCSKYSSIHLADLNFIQIMEVFDLAERFTENWIFS